MSFPTQERLDANVYLHSANVSVMRSLNPASSDAQALSDLEDAIFWLERAKQRLKEATRPAVNDPWEHVEYAR